MVTNKTENKSTHIYKKQHTLVFIYTEVFFYEKKKLKFNGINICRTSSTGFGTLYTIKKNINELLALWLTVQFIAFSWVCIENLSLFIFLFL